MKRIAFILLALTTLTTQLVKAQTVKDSTVTAIYTDFKSYWTSNTKTNNSVYPDTSHNLLAFTFRGKTYSTGANDAVLTTKLGSSNYSAQVYKSLPVSNIAGKTVGGANTLALALKDDGDSTKAAFQSPYPIMHIADVLTDGKNGLDLGTGVTNLPQGAHISFPIRNMSINTATDSVPDFVFTQIAEPTTNQPDTIFFFDANNNVVGNKKLVFWNAVSKLGTYKLDLYSLTPNMSCNTSIMNGLFEQNGTRDIRMVAFLISEFGITDSKLASQVKGLQINPCGSSDQAFIAYNTNAISFDVPIIFNQPTTQTFCSASTSSVTFSVKAFSNTTMTYQWKKNGADIVGATSSSYTATSLTMADTANAYSVTLANAVGAITSDNSYVKYLITSQPLSQAVATGNSVSFSVGVSGVASYQWQKKGVSITGATSSTYTLPVVNYSDSGKYSVQVFATGATACISDTAVLQPSIVLYSKASGNLNLPSTWGVATDGSGSSPLDFTRNEHTFILSNRSSLSTGGSVTIAGTVDVAGGKLTLTPGTTLTAGRIIRSGSTGTIAGSSSSNLSLTGISIVGYSSSSDLYFDPINDTLHNLTIATIAAHTVTLHTALAITAGTTPGSVQVNGGGTLNTSDSLVLKSDINGTASIASSAGMITGKVTIEKFIHARRAWRLMSAPITSVNAPSINAAWQEGATSSTDNPHPGFGTHITYGALSDGFDQNPQKTFSMKIYNSATSSWTGVTATKTTVITSYPAYFIFIRGNRSYNILTTTGYTTPMTTVLRATGNVNQGNIAAKTVAATGLTLVANPYASPVNFTKIVSAGSNIKARYRVWDPTLAGTYGVGAWVTVDGSTGTYKAIPPSSYVAGALEAGQGFFVETGDGKTAGSLLFTEAVKDATLSTTSADRMGGATTDTSLEVNLKLFNADTTTAIADGVLFQFGSAYNDSVDNNDAAKLSNTGENLAIKEGNSLLTIDERTMPRKGDSLYLSFTNAPSASYQFEIVPSSLNNQSFALYDRYLKTLSPLSSSDTTRITFSVNTSVAASKAADRFVLVVMSSKITNTVLPVVFTGIKAAAKEKTIDVQWTVANESGILYYEVQKSADGASFTAAGNVLVNGASLYSFSDASPLAGANYYRIKSVSKNGAVLYSAVAVAQWQAAGDAGSSAASSVSVYPNPLKGTSFTLTLSNMAAGSYNLSVLDATGKTIFTQPITHNGGTEEKKISLTNKLVPGVYQVIISSGSSKNITKVVAL